MNPKKRKSGIKIKPLEGKFFDFKPPKGRRTPPANSKSRNFKSFVILAILVFIGLNIFNVIEKGKDYAIESKEIALEGYSQLQKGIDYAKDKDFEKADNWFKEAEISFNKIKENSDFLKLTPNDIENYNLALSSAENLIDSGIIVTQIGQDLSNFAISSSGIPQTFIEQSINGSGETKITDLIKEKKNELDPIINKVIDLKNNLTNINESILPEELKEKLKIGVAQVEEVINITNKFNSNFRTILKILGDEVPHHYLLLMQNNHELRATGGFIGSYMLIDINDGVITKMEAKDVYETDGQLKDFVEAPPGIDKVAPQLFMRDANYSPDFPASAENIMWFLEHSNQPSVDTVIAIDQDVAEKILEITGPIHLEHFPFQIKPENFNNLISYYIEAKISNTSTPKQILFDFIPVFKEKVLTSENTFELKDKILELVSSRHIQAYSKDADIQNIISEFNLDGAFPEAGSETDFLALVSTSIGGNKSDGFIKTNIEHDTYIDDSGTITDKLTITKNHKWNINDIPELDKLIQRYGTGELDLHSLLFILGEGENLDYMRIYVPKGTKLLSGNGEIEEIEITEDLGYTVFAFIYGPISAGESNTISFEYELPFKANNSYNFSIQKQAGTNNRTIRKILTVDDSIQVNSSSPSSLNPFSLKPVVEADLNENFEFSAELSR